MTPTNETSSRHTSSRHTSSRNASETTSETGAPDDWAAPEGIDTIDGVDMYRVGPMEPFLMSVVSSNDLWMFVSSTGGLTAGRISPEYPLFPYETDDRLHHLGGRVGPITVISFGDGEVWEPFTGATGDAAGARRSLHKSLLTDSVVFTERHPERQLTMSYRWAPSDRFGWIRTAWLANDGDAEVQVDVVDGLLGLMPWGINPTLQQQMSNLANAYRRSEMIDAGIGIYTLESRISDLPQPAEAMKATVVWSTGLADGTADQAGGAGAAGWHSVDPAIVRATRAGYSLHDDNASPALLTGRPGAYLVGNAITLGPGETRRWCIAADVSQDHRDVADLRATIGAHQDRPAELVREIEDDIAAGHRRLAHLIAGADGAQSTGSVVMDTHHAANTLFNIMRGGTFIDGYQIEADRLRDFVRRANVAVTERHRSWLDELDDHIDVGDLLNRAQQLDDPNMTRLVMEYLPLSFSRRHGDPSRPWNRFEIRVQDDDGAPILSYQGNWRDIFQNWEALSRTYPAFLPSVIARFLNASTADGYNPYRVNSEGVDWEVPEPDNPWSGIGYWGDHQIVYLYRLLKTQEEHAPGWLKSELRARRYAFADVPYRIAPYADIVNDPKNTIEYDAAADQMVDDRVAAIGTDGRLVPDGDGGVLHVSMLEKLLIPALTKLSNYVPRGGIWMNTERPEWNDANNALVGYGLSMVTLAYLYRYLTFLNDLLDDFDGTPALSPQVTDWLTAITDALEGSLPLLDGDEVDPAARAVVVHQLGSAFGTYRATVYESGLQAPQPTSAATQEGDRPERGTDGRDLILRLLDASRRHLRDAIVQARRPDGLFDAYNLIEFSDDHTSAIVHPLQPMLEGQVAVISSGVLDQADVADLLETMFASPLYRNDVNSFILYPATARPSFTERNIVPRSAVDDVPLLVALRQAGDTSIVALAADDNLYFNGDFANADDLGDALDALAESEFADMADANRVAVLSLYEDVFGHHAFTGRSASMYAFEGIGSVYWHMVAKLLLAVQESILTAPDDTDPAAIARLTELYDRVRSGLGFNKTAAEYGAFPTDPYSHTPAHAGAQQPGMTGQVKEELLTRWAEVGVRVFGGQIHFDPRLVGAAEFGGTERTMDFVDAVGNDATISIPGGMIGFTLCRTPIVATTGESASITVTDSDGHQHRFDQRSLPHDWSSRIFAHDTSVARVDVVLVDSELGRR